jgi:hypothetical protein
MDKYLFNGNNTMDVDLKKKCIGLVCFSLTLFPKIFPITSFIVQAERASGVTEFSTLVVNVDLFLFYWRYNPLWVSILQPSSGAIASSRTRFLDHTQRRATVGRTPLDE